ncbi:DASS family sodium-coupled anion symporter [Bacillus sp. CLL-7-23]|uniref:Sodium-dependent dicarboxylate transporter SdcS n=1 Tax=Bacillus changyiensis TaxID=3004103 RepID=A0ABT4X3B9_9BACI|nr:DASS family sodium-coupled anion symporter [Bacillus changyiensis]MDA7026746.1 DASS family sodium-coupled anion symporter [Bacillus changyiensis]
MNVYTPTKLTGLLLGPISFLLIFMLMPEAELAHAPRIVLAVTAWTAIWWITEAVPIPAASLLPIILLPTFDGLDVETTAKAYGDPIVFMYMGGFIIAIAIEKWNLHKRIALHILKLIGTESQRIVLGVMLSTACLSMWISNAATALMMLPVALAVIKEVEEKHVLTGESLQKFSKSILLAVAYAASIGGLATLVGSVPNAVFAAMSRKLLHHEILFFEWFLFGFPVAIVFLLILYIYLTKIKFKVNDFAGKKPEFINHDLKKLGATTNEEKWVFSVFLLTACLWMFKFLLPFHISDPSIAILGAVLLFIIPSTKDERILNWKDLERLPWGLLLLFGGGLSLASGFSETNLTGWIAGKLQLLEGNRYLFVLIVLTAAILFMTEIMSNTAVANMVIPMSVGLGTALHVEPSGLMAAAALASSCAFMLPISTPPNAAVFSAQLLEMKDMIRAGFWLNITGIFMIVTSVYLWLPAVLQ